jgi:hypothetical protein
MKKKVPTNRFELSVPPDWTDESFYSFSGPVEDGIKHGVEVFVEEKVGVQDVQQYALSHGRSLESELQGFEELKNEPLVLGNELPAHEIVYRWSPLQDTQVYQRVVLVLVGDTGYALRSTFSKKSWKTLGPEIDEIVRSFQPE